LLTNDIIEWNSYFVLQLQISLLLIDLLRRVTFYRKPWLKSRLVEINDNANIIDKLMDKQRLLESKVLFVMCISLHSQCTQIVKSGISALDRSWSTSKPQTAFFAQECSIETESVSARLPHGDEQRAKKKKHFAAETFVHGLVSVHLDNRCISQSATVYFTREHSENENLPITIKSLDGRVDTNNFGFISSLFFHFPSCLSPVLPLDRIRIFAHRSFYIWGTKSNFSANIPSRLTRS